MSSAVATIKQDVVPQANWHQTEPFELLQYWRSVAKRKWMVVAVAVLCGVATAAGLSFVTPTYRATTTLMIEQGRSRLVSIEEVYSGVSPNREHYQTQAEMLKSPALAHRVIEKLSLSTHPELDPRQRRGPAWMQAMGLAEVGRTEWTADSLTEAVLNQFLRRITIEPVRLTQLVKLSFDASDAEFAAKVVNTLAEVYIEADIQFRARITQRATDLLADRLAGLRDNMEGSERALQQYREREGLLDMKGLAQSGASRQLELLTAAEVEARERRIGAESTYAQVSKGRELASLPMVLSHPSVERSKRAEAEAERIVAELSDRYGAEHPRMVQAQANLKQARENSRGAIDRVVTSFAKDHAAAVAGGRQAERALADGRGAIQHMNRKEFQLDALENDLTTNRQIYEKFMNRYRETRAGTDTQGGLVARIIDAAVPPGGVYKPRKERIVPLGFLFGLMAGVIIALLLERLNSTVKSANEVEEKLGLPAMAVVPLLSGNSATAPARYYLDEPKSVFSEAIRTARTSILLAGIDSPNKTLLVTSSVPSEGKTAFAINMAVAHAQTSKTLLIEADLRRPTIAKQLGLDEDRPGLTDLFMGAASFADCVQRVEGSSLYVLPAGRIPENPLELLGSDRFRQMLDRIHTACEVVIIDSPPVHLVSDAVYLASVATGVLFVVKANSTPYPLARRCIRTLEEAGGSILGVALNQLDFEKADTYYGAYTGYSKEYSAYYGKPA